jgi:hypothetical protein
MLPDTSSLQAERYLLVTLGRWLKNEGLPSELGNLTFIQKRCLPTSYILRESSLTWNPSYQYVSDIGRMVRD